MSYEEEDTCIIVMIIIIKPAETPKSPHVSSSSYDHDNNTCILLLIIIKPAETPKSLEVNWYLVDACVSYEEEDTCVSKSLDVNWYQVDAVESQARIHVRHMRRRIHVCQSHLMLSVPLNTYVRIFFFVKCSAKYLCKKFS